MKPHRNPTAAALHRIAELETSVRALARLLEAAELDRDRYRAALTLTRACVHSAQQEAQPGGELDALWVEVELLTRAGRAAPVPVVVVVPELAGVAS